MMLLATMEQLSFLIFCLFYHLTRTNFTRLIYDFFFLFILIKFCCFIYFLLIKLKALERRFCTFSAKKVNLKNFFGSMKQGCFIYYKKEGHVILNKTWLSANKNKYKFTTF